MKFRLLSRNIHFSCMQVYIYIYIYIFIYLEMNLNLNVIFIRKCFVYAGDKCFEAVHFSNLDMRATYCVEYLTRHFWNHVTLQRMLCDFVLRPWVSPPPPPPPPILCPKVVSHGWKTAKWGRMADEGILTNLKDLSRPSPIGPFYAAVAEF
jgi:hypothetical protein